MKAKKRISQRVYPSRKCKQCGEVFIPTDARQVYCRRQHGIDFNNDLRGTKEAAMKSIGDLLTKNDKILNKAYESLERLKQEAISMDILQYEGYNFEICSSVSVNKKTGKKIQWNISYGIEGFDEIRKTFIIHKK